MLQIRRIRAISFKARLAGLINPYHHHRHNQRSAILIGANGCCGGHLRACISTAPSTKPDPNTKASCDNFGSLVSLAATLLSSSFLRTSVIAVTSLVIGFQLGTLYQNNSHNPDHHTQQHVLPSGLPRTCCDESTANTSSKDNLTKDQVELKTKLVRLLGREHVIDAQTESTQTLPYLKGARLGKGRALLILTPQNLQDVVDAVKIIVDADCVIVPQGQNTGLTGGSVPSEQTDDSRPVVILSFRDLNRMFPLDMGKRMVCLAGAGLASLHQFLKKEFPDREPHSVLGSTFLNPTTAAGVAFGSGGTQLRKGPAYTDRSLYLTISATKWGERQVKIVNTLGIQGLEKLVERRRSDSIPSVVDRWSRWVQGGYERLMQYSSREGESLWAHDVTYGERLCSFPDRDSSNDESLSDISRFNADTKGSFPNRSEGKVIILATVHDTFPVPEKTKTFWISFDSLDTALAFRRQVCLHNPQDLPISLEYMDKDAFDVINQAGRLLSNTICLVGTASPILRQLWNFKLWVEALPFDGATLWVDRFLFAANHFIPAPLPSTIMRLANHFDHHAALTVGEFGGGELDRLIQRMQDFANKAGQEKMKIHECKGPRESQSLLAFRFAAAPAFRTYCVGNRLQGISVDYALPKSRGQVPPLSLTGNSTTSDGDDVDDKENNNLPVKRMRYSHFGCNVVHEDLAYLPGCDVQKAKYALKHAVETGMGGRLPSEHGHGREYVAPPVTQARWKQMDPLNVCNPGIGGLSYKPEYRE
ncbi:hypothetical protein ACA910_002655 [Epithemia clementina (nom. ined.)]